MSFDVDVRHNYNTMKKNISDYWVVETHPFAIVSHRVIVEMSDKDAKALKDVNPDLNIRKATRDDLKDDSIDQYTVNWTVAAEKELSDLRLLTVKETLMGV